jgi:hypothetical protein
VVRFRGGMSVSFFFFPCLILGTGLALFRGPKGGECEWELGADHKARTLMILDPCQVPTNPNHYRAAWFLLHVHVRVMRARRVPAGWVGGWMASRGFGAGTLLA